MRLVVAPASGNSIGGLCSLAVASDRDSLPFHLSSLVLFNSAGGMTGFRYQDVPRWAHAIMGHFQYFLLGPAHGPLIYRAFASRGTIQSVLTQGGIYKDTKHVDEDLLDMLLAPTSDPGAQQVFLSVFGGPAGPTRESLLEKIKMPILALWGADDPFTPLDDAVKALPLLTADMTLEAIPNAGHCLHDEHPG